MWIQYLVLTDMLGFKLTDNSVTVTVIVNLYHTGYYSSVASLCRFLCAVYFLSRDSVNAERAIGYAIARPSVCPSVCHTGG